MSTSSKSSQWNLRSYLFSDFFYKINKNDEGSLSKDRNDASVFN